MRFEAVYQEKEADRKAQWTVVEWIKKDQDGNDIEKAKHGRIVWSTYDTLKGGEKAKVIAKEKNLEIKMLKM